MPVRPLDLQVNINTLIEASRAQSVKQSHAAAEQRMKDLHNIEDAKSRAHKVNKTPDSDNSHKLKDTNDHFGNKTENELEEEYASKKDKKRKDESSKSEISSSSKNSEKHIDYMA